MIKMQAPHPALVTTIFLPDPDLGDSEGFTQTMIRKTAIDGTPRTYVRRNDGRKRITIAFRLTRHKALEFRAFLRAYESSVIRMTDHLERIWIGNFITNPQEFEGAVRAADVAGEELYNIQTEFQGTIQ